MHELQVRALASADISHVADEPADGRRIDQVRDVYFHPSRGSVDASAPEQVLHGRTGVLHRTAVFDDENRVRSMLHQGAEAFFALLLLLRLGELPVVRRISGRGTTERGFLN